MKALKLIIFAAIMLGITFSSCTKETKVLNTVEVEKDYTYKTPKYVFLFIGDGMAQVQVNASKLASRAFGMGSMNINNFKVLGSATTFPDATDYITDSAAAGTALATGHKTKNGIVSMSSDKTEAYKTIAELAKEKNMKVGIISSVSIDHATPACFYAHQDTRSNYTSIASQMAHSNFDYFAGGFSKSKNNILQEMETAGYNITDTRDELNGLKKGSKYWAYTGYDRSKALAYDIDRTDNNISLKEFTTKGIELLDNENGFFMMVEGGKIDWACHANDAKSAICDVLAFDDAVGAALDFYNNHKDETLIIVTGDHECGGMTIGFAATGKSINFNLLNNQKISFQKFSTLVSEWTKKGNIDFDSAMIEVSKHFGLGNETLDSNLKLTTYELNKLKAAFAKTMDNSLLTKEDGMYLYGSYDPFTVTITHILNNKAGLSFASFTHTGVPVPVFALGQGEKLFDGSYDNTDIPNKIIKLAKLR